VAVQFEMSNAGITFLRFGFANRKVNFHSSISLLLTVRAMSSCVYLGQTLFCILKLDLGRRRLLINGDTRRNWHDRLDPV
jgi:hypothetical protein